MLSEKVEERRLNRVELSRSGLRGEPPKRICGVKEHSADIAADTADMMAGIQCDSRQSTCFLDTLAALGKQSRQLFAEVRSNFPLRRAGYAACTNYAMRSS